MHQLFHCTWLGIYVEYLYFYLTQLCLSGKVLVLSSHYNEYVPLVLGSCPCWDLGLLHSISDVDSEQYVTVLLKSLSLFQWLICITSNLTIAPDLLLYMLLPWLSSLNINWTGLSAVFHNGLSLTSYIQLCFLAVCSPLLLLWVCFTLIGRCFFLFDCEGV